MMLSNLSDLDFPVTWAVLYVLCHVWKPIVALLLKVFHGKGAKLMDPTDSVNAEQFEHSGRHFNIINGTFVLEGQDLTEEQLTSKFQEVLRDTTAFWKLACLKKLFFGYWAWVPAREVKLWQHIRFHDVSRYSYTDRDHLARVVMHQLRQEPCLPSDLPPWRVTVYLSADKTETAVNFRFDHAVLDGFSLFHILMPALANGTVAKPTLPADPRFRTGVKVIAELIGQREDGPRHFGRYSDRNPVKQFVEEHETAVCVGKWSRKIPLERWKKTARKWGTGVNHLFLACYSVALDNLMQKVHDQLSDR
jgi:hypothetical protein